MAGEGPAGDAAGRSLTVDAEPYPWPWDRCFDPLRIALVLCGGQRFFADRTHDAVETVARIDALAAVLRERGALVVHLRHDGAHLAAEGRPRRAPVATDDDAAMVLTLDPHDLVVDCRGFDGCCGSTLELRLQLARRDLVVLAGLGLEGPVHSTMRSLNDRGVECLLLPDASSPYDLDLGPRAVHSTTMSGGIFGAVSTVPALLDALRARTH
jgi:nicotinamidase-related amidase